MHLTIAHSPDSDDAYMMAPLALGWLDPEGFQFSFVRKDIETLNGEALEGRYEVTAISFGVYPEIANRYQLLSAGSSIQEGTGPLVVAREPMGPVDLSGVEVAVPGLRTSALLAFRRYAEAHGFTPRVTCVPFDQILPALVEGRFQAGLLINESQLQYHLHGLDLVADLGAWWKDTQDLPLPMGGNAIRKDLPWDLRVRFATLMRKSVALARVRHEESVDYAQGFGRGMDRRMVSRYVQAWVNDFTEDPGPRGRLGVSRLLGREAEWVQG
ncbi:MAG: ABC transporter substrate-binding protein [Acidobacteria bacterium]|nr:ABC transporter substrate-binding protein [Acidobacteriota bacterium]